MLLGKRLKRLREELGLTPEALVAGVDEGTGTGFTVRQLAAIEENERPTPQWLINQVRHFTGRSLFQEAAQ